jgi:hypothetical protein
MSDKLSLADQGKAIVKDEVRLQAEHDGTRGRVALTADHRITRHVTLRAYVEAIFAGTKARPTAGVEVTWRPTS